MLKSKKPIIITIEKLYKVAKTFDQKLKKTDLDKKCKTWAKELKEVEEQFEILQKKIHGKDHAQPAELRKKFMELSKITTKIQKNLRRSLKTQAKERSKIQEKLLSKLGQVNNPDKLLLDATQVFCTSIAQKSGELKTLLEQTTQLLEIQLKTGQALELLVLKLSIPDTLESCDQESKTLNERMEAVCQTAAALPAHSASQASDPLVLKIKTALFSFRAQYTRGNQLLEQMSLNLSKTFPDNDQKEAAKDTGISTTPNTTPGATPALAAFPAPSLQNANAAAPAANAPAANNNAPASAANVIAPASAANVIAPASAANVIAPASAANESQIITTEQAVKMQAKAA